MDLHKAYYTLDWYRCLETLTMYGGGPRALRLLQTYWGYLAMVTRDRFYYVPPLQGIPRCYTGIPLTYTIFNVVVVVDAVICDWVTVVTAIEADAEGLGMLIQDLMA